MYILEEHPDCISLTLKNLSAVSMQIAASVSPACAALKITAGQEILCADGIPATKIYRLVDGALKHKVAGKPLFIYEAGDFLGLESLSSMALPDLRTDFAVTVDEYDSQSIKKKIEEDPNFAAQILRYHALRAELAERMLSHKLAAEMDEHAPLIKHFEVGQVIVREGEESSDVLNLLEGSADVFLAGVKIGEIGQDEIFGAIASLCNKPRTATVIARTRCVVLQLKAEEFKSLIEHRPQAVLRLLENLANTIINLNERVVAAEKGEGGPGRGALFR